MASYTTVLDYTDYREGGRVEAVTIRKTTDDKYPCGYDYSLHYGTLDGETLLRYLEKSEIFDDSSKRLRRFETTMPTNRQRATSVTRRTESNTSSFPE